MSNHYAMCKYDDATGTYIPLEVRPYIDDFQAGAASRDAEVAKLKTVPMKYRRMAFNAQLQDEVARLEQENDQLREQVALLRDALKEAVEDYSDRFDMSSQSTNPGIKWIVKQGKEALTATEPKP